MGKLKSLMMRTEEMLANCLNDKGMTNEQALAFIKSKLGVMCHDHAKDTLKEWKNEELNKLLLEKFNLGVTK